MEEFKDEDQLMVDEEQKPQEECKVESIVQVPYHPDES